MLQELSFITNFIKFIKIISVGILQKNNMQVYESNDVVSFYVEQALLQKPEETILNEFRERLPQMKMLDIGVGAGRTTVHFAGLAKEYLGIDYSSKMINACRQRFSIFPAKAAFNTCDARSMERFHDNTFDFILFSFNGIDYVEHEDRIRTLVEIRRILKTGGYFCFSTHNLNFLLKKCSLKLSRHPSILALRIFELLEMRIFNTRGTWKAIRNPLRNSKHRMIKDDAFEFRLKTYYITPNEQLKQLRELGYSGTKMYSLTNGRVIKNRNNTMDHWIYYLSQTS